MTKLVIFGGTTEGRELAFRALDNGFSVILCVATDYGESLCDKRDDLTVRKGRMDLGEMTAFFDECAPSLIIDATHPHAVLVSENIRAAAESADIPLMRVVRAPVDLSFTDKYPEWGKDSVFYVSSADEALSCLETDEKPVLLTTGSKEISVFSSLPDFSHRVYARVLPECSAISACKREGLDGAHIIAMQGPFSTELNLALINFTGAKWLITKESGQSGGFYEKVEAAAKSGIRLVVIGRPGREEGLSLSEAEKELERLRDKEKGTDLKKELNTPDITLIGMGMGTGSQLTLEALDRLREASVIFGAARMIDDIRPYVGEKSLIPLYREEEIISFLNSHPEYDRACVVFSGDTGFYSGCSDFGRGYNIHILPGISSFSCLCARFGLREEEFTPASAHGRNVDVTGLLKTYGKVFLLLDKQTNIGSVCRTLVDAGYPDTFIYAGVRLGYPDEETFCGRAEDLMQRSGDDLAVMAMEKGEGQHA